MKLPGNDHVTILNCSSGAETNKLFDNTRNKKVHAVHIRGGSGEDSRLQVLTHVGEQGEGAPEEDKARQQVRVVLWQAAEVKNTCWSIWALITHYRQGNQLYGVIRAKVGTPGANARTLLLRKSTDCSETLRMNIESQSSV